MKALLLFFVSLNLSAAQFFTGPISSGMGGTGRAGISSAEGAFLNPATLPLIKNYEFIGYYRDGYVDTGQHRQGWMVGAVDNSEGVYFPGSFHFGKIRDTGRADDPTEGEVWHGAMAYLVTDRLSVGASLYRLLYDIEGHQDYTQWSGGLGAIFLVHEDLAFAYVLDNIGKPGSATPIALREDLEQAFGVFWRFAELATLRFDVSRRENLNPDKKLTYMAGVESATSEYMVFRFGFRREEQAERKLWTAGIGFKGPRLRMDYSIEKNEERTSGALHSVDMRIPF